MPGWLARFCSSAPSKPWTIRISNAPAAAAVSFRSCTRPTSTDRQQTWCRASSKYKINSYMDSTSSQLTPFWLLHTLAPFDGCYVGLIYKEFSVLLLEPDTFTLLLCVYIQQTELIMKQILFIIDFLLAIWHIYTQTQVAAETSGVELSPFSPFGVGDKCYAAVAFLFRKFVMRFNSSVATPSNDSATQHRITCCPMS